MFNWEQVEWDSKNLAFSKGSLPPDSVLFTIESAASEADVAAKVN
jgi:hypothetical protein